MLPQFRKVNVRSEEALKNFQDAVAQVFQVILKKQIIDGALIEEITITSGTPYSISHGLGKDPRGWVVTKINADATVWETDSSVPSKTLILNASATVTISLWVF